MNSKAISLRTFLFFGCYFIVMAVYSQIKITFPVEKQIFQRNNANQATISIGGYFTETVTRVEARLLPVISGQGQQTEWATIQNNITGASFLGTLTGRGGWYTLEVRGFNGSKLIGQDAIARVGIGEVFVIAGQSNAEGIYDFGAPSPQDNRVITTTWNNRESDKTDKPILSFTELTAEGLIGPRGRSSWCWGALGGLLVKKLNVPVLLLNVGWNDTSTQNWLDAAQNKPVLNRLGNYLPLGMPYLNLKSALQYYGSILGIRAVLWQQGENDAAAGVSKNAYINSFQGFIDIARSQQADVSSFVSWVISRTALNSSNGVYFSNQDIIDAQNAIISIPFNKCYPGPYTDNIQVPRPDGGHFQGQGLAEVARAWDNSLPPSFFATVVPVMARQLLPISITCNTPAVSFNAKAPNGFSSYLWSTGETTQIITVKGAGTYQVTMKDNAGNTYLTAPITVTENVEPPVPTITPSGEQVICADSSILLSVNVSSVNTVTWSNSFEGRTISVKNPGQYTARISNIYGCTSSNSAPVTIKTISMKAPTVIQSGPYSVQAAVDSTIYSFADSKVSDISWDWQQGSRTLPNKQSAIKTTSIGAFSARSRVTFVSSAGGSSRTCVSPFSSEITVRPAGEEEGLIIYPNPSRHGKIAIETFQDLTNVQITVAHISGQVVYREKLPVLDIRKVVDLSHLPDGEYIFKVSSTTLNDSRRIIIDY